MAQVPYGEGVPQVNAEVNTPQDTQHIDVNATQFGGAVAQGLQQFGAGAEKAKDFYNKAVIDDAYNNAAKKMTDLVHGDPEKTITGPDGSVQIDTGFLGKRRRDAMDARPQAEADLEKIIQDGKNSLSTPEQQHEFESSVRRLQDYHTRQIGSHTNQQANEWYGSTNKASADLALNSISSNPYDIQHINHSLSDLRNSYMNQVRLEGGGAAQAQDAINRANRDGTRAWIEAVSVNDPARAKRMVEENKDTLGQAYEPLALQVKARSDKMVGDQKADEKMGQARGSMPYSNKNNPVFTQTWNTVQGGYSSPEALARTVQLESSGNPSAVSPGGGYIGLGQIGEKEFKQYGPPGGSRLNPEDSIYATANLAKANATRLQASLGRYPTDAEIYLAHQQGAAGASKLLANPNARAGDLVGDKAISGNGGDPNAPAWQFTNHWVEKFNGHGGIDHPYGGPNVQLPTMAGGPPTPSPSGTPGSIQSAGIPTLGQTQVAGAPQLSAPMAAKSQLSNMPTSDYVRAHALQGIEEDVKNGIMTEDEADHARNKIIRKSSEQKMLEESNGELKKQIENKAAGELYNKMHDPSKNGNIVQEIYSSNDIDWNMKQKLVEIARGDEKNGTGTMASPDHLAASIKIENGEIDSFKQLYQMQIDKQLTSRDVQSLSEDLTKIQNSPEEKQILKSKNDSLKSIETQVVYNGRSSRKRPSPEGRAFYDSDVVNRFESEFRAFRRTDEGKKNPHKFFEQKNIERFYSRAPSPSSLENSTIQNGVSQAPASPASQGQAALAPIAESIPPVPQGIDPKGWESAVHFRPIVNGSPVPTAKWGAAISYLVSNPTPEVIKHFDDYVAPSGMTSRDIFEKIAPQHLQLAPKRTIKSDISMIPEAGKD